MAGPWAGPVFQYIAPLDGRDDELDYALGTISGDLLGAIIVTNNEDLKRVNALKEITGCDCCPVCQMNPQDATKKYKITDAPARSQTEMLVQMIRVDEPLVFNYLADQFAKVDYPDDGEWGLC